MRFLRRRRQFIDPNLVLFTVPTVSAEVPPVGKPAPRGASVLSVSEDEWRQIEFVSRSWREAVDAELGDIRRIITHDRIEGEIVGYRNCHARSRVARPLAIETTLDGLAAYFAVVHKLDGMETAYNQMFIADTAACLVAANVALYAHCSGGNIDVLGFLGRANADDAEGLAPRLSRLMQNYDLDLIHWREAQRVSWDVGDIATFLTRAA
jgi:hypothetical protein